MAWQRSRIDDLIAMVKGKWKPVPSTRYNVSFTGLMALENRALSFNLEAIDMPGMSFSDDEQIIISSPVRKIPQRKTYANEITLSVRLTVDPETSDLTQRRYFENWMNMIYNYDTQEFSWYKEYIDDMTLSVQDENDDIIYECVFEEVYPLEVSAISLSPKGDYLKQDIKLAYYRWRNVLWPRTVAPDNIEMAAVGGDVVPVPVKLGGMTLGQYRNLNQRQSFLSRKLANRQSAEDLDLEGEEAARHNAQTKEMEAEKRQVDSELRIADAGVARRQAAGGSGFTDV